MSFALSKFFQRSLETLPLPGLLLLPVISAGVGTAILLGYSVQRGMGGADLELLGLLTWSGAIALTWIAAQLVAQRFADLEQRYRDTRTSLQHQERWLQQYSQLSPGNIYILVQAPDGRVWFEYMSLAIEAIHEIAVDQILQDAGVLLENIVPEDRLGYETAVRQSAANLSPFLHQWRIVTPSGRVKWLQGNSQPERRQNGDIAWYGVVIEITDRKQDEAALDETEKIHRAILAAIPDLMIRMHRDGTYLEVKLTDSFPLAITKDAVGKNIFELLPEPVAQKRLAVAQTALETGKMQVYEFSFSIQGEYLWQEARIVPLNCHEVLVLVQDLTQRKLVEESLRQSEELFRQAFDKAPIGISLVSSDGKFLKVNTYYCNLLGYTEDELLQKHFQELTHPDDLAADLAGLAQMQRGEIQTLQMEKRFISKQGTIIPVFLNASMVRDRQGHPLYSVGHIQDIRDRLEVDRLKDEFVSIVSHELRTPITSIEGSLMLLGAGVYDDRPAKARQMLDIAINNSHRLVRLVDDILTFERLESGKVQLTLELCQVAELIQQAIDSVSTLAEESAITLMMPPVNATLQAAPDAIVQTLTNLLSNAIKFSYPRQTIWVTAQVWSGAAGELDGEMTRWRDSEVETLAPTPPHHPHPPSPHSILFVVKDQGRGIPPDKREKIFEQFQQVDVSDSRKKGGTGLGLAICKRIVQQHGGTIWVESELGQGSTFYFTIPVGDVDRESAL